MKLQKDQANDAVAAYHKCKDCTKFFASRDFLRKHYERAHPNIDFYEDFPDVPKIVSPKREPLHKEKIKQELIESELQPKFDSLSSELDSLKRSIAEQQDSQYTKVI